VNQAVTVTDDRVIVTLTGKMRIAEAVSLREQVLELVERGHTRFTIDVAKLKFIDGAGLGVLVALQRRTLSRGGGVVIRGVRGSVKEMFELTQLHKLFEIN
jgi:anti-sigma B factor antagonist